MKVLNRVALVALAVLISGVHAQGRKDRPDILVSVENGRTTVREERAHTSPDEGAIWWRAPEGYRFPANGIVIENDAAKFACGPQANGKRFRCSKRVHTSGEEYKYTVNLVEEASGQALEPLDPVIISD